MLKGSIYDVFSLNNKKYSIILEKIILNFFRKVWRFQMLWQSW